MIFYAVPRFVRLGSHPLRLGTAYTLTKLYTSNAYLRSIGYRLYIPEIVLLTQANLHMEPLLDPDMQ